MWKWFIVWETQERFIDQHRLLLTNDANLRFKPIHLIIRLNEKMKKSKDRGNPWHVWHRKKWKTFHFVWAYIVDVGKVGFPTLLDCWLLVFSAIVCHQPIVLEHICLYGAELLNIWKCKGINLEAFSRALDTALVQYFDVLCSDWSKHHDEGFAFQENLYQFYFHVLFPWFIQPSLRINELCLRARELHILMNIHYSSRYLSRRALTTSWESKPCWR